MHISRFLPPPPQVGDQLTLSIVAHDGSIGSRSELFVVVKEAIHGGEPPVLPSTSSTSSTTSVTSTSTSTSTSSTTVSKTTTVTMKAAGTSGVMGEEEMAQADEM